MKKSLFCMIFILLVLTFVSNVLAEEKIDSRVYSELNSEDKVSVIIEVKEDTGFLGMRSNNSEKIAGDIEEINKKDGNLIAANISEGELDRLKNDKSVKNVEYSYLFRASLQDSVGILNVTGVWPIVERGENISGIDETVCIIDTGIDFTHPDLRDENKTCVIDCYGKSCAENCSIGDDNGHGTHVAGIVAASGKINGIAKGANLIGLKVLDSGGGASPSSGVIDIANAIDWCVANSNRYNISVVSMSLGTVSIFPNYCDSFFDSTITRAINNATLYNISVVSASGNSGFGVGRSTDSIAAPACIENATSVSATNKDDGISSYGHYNNITDFFAPGTSINSTYVGGGYTGLSGTSMSAPHAAGAFAIIRQFYRLNNVIAKPEKILSVLKNNGKTIIASGFNLTRIDVYKAVNYLRSPQVKQVNPKNGIKTKANQTFSCNESGEIYPINNATFSIYNSTALIYNSSLNVWGLNNVSNFSYNFPYEGDFYWNCLAYNNISLFTISENFTITYDLTKPIFTFVYPINNSWLNAGRFNLTINEDGNCNYSLNNGINNMSMSSLDNKTLNYINNTLNEGSYGVRYYCMDYSGNENKTFVNFKVDFSKPNVSLSLPENEYSSTNGLVDFSYNVSDNLNISFCDLIANSAIVASDNSNMTNISYSFPAGDYYWQINCTDEAGNMGNSSLRHLTISSPPVASSENDGGGGGGGGSAKIINSSLNKTVENQNTTNQNITNNVENNLSNGVGLTGNAVSESSNESIQSAGRGITGNAALEIGKKYSPIGISIVAGFVILFFLLRRFSRWIFLRKIRHYK